MKSSLLAAVILCACLIGCKKASPPTAGPSAPQKIQQTAEPNSRERTNCNKHQLQSNGCGEYKVLSYDATWENGLGNKGAFVLEREGLIIRATCGSNDCSDFSQAVGKVVIADKSIGDLITQYEPSCEDPLFVQTAIDAYKRNTGKYANWGTVCQTTLIVEKIEVKPMPKNE
jgi:hypothetical protein